MIYRSALWTLLKKRACDLYYNNNYYYYNNNNYYYYNNCSIDRHIYFSPFQINSSAAGLKALNPAANGAPLNVQIITVIYDP